MFLSIFGSRHSYKDPILLRTPDQKHLIINLLLNFLESVGIHISFATIKFGPPRMPRTYVMVDLSD